MVLLGSSSGPATSTSGPSTGGASALIASLDNRLQRKVATASAPGRKSTSSAPSGDDLLAAASNSTNNGTTG